MHLSDSLLVSAGDGAFSDNVDTYPKVDNPTTRPRCNTDRARHLRGMRDKRYPRSDTRCRPRWMARRWSRTSTVNRACSVFIQSLGFRKAGVGRCQQRTAFLAGEKGPKHVLNLVLLLFRGLASFLFFDGRAAPARCLARAASSGDNQRMRLPTPATELTEFVLLPIEARLRMMTITLFTLPAPSWEIELTNLRLAGGTRSPRRRTLFRVRVVRQTLTRRGGLVLSPLYFHVCALVSGSCAEGQYGPLGPVGVACYTAGGDQHLATGNVSW